MTREFDGARWPVTDEEIAAADAEMHRAQALQAELTSVVQRHVDAGLSPAAAADALKATAASKIAELEGGDDLAWCAAGHVLRRFGGDIAAMFARRLAPMTRPPAGRA
jgi:hypothetical protein